MIWYIICIDHKQPYPRFMFLESQIAGWNRPLIIFCMFLPDAQLTRFTHSTFHFISLPWAPSKVASCWSFIWLGIKNPALADCVHMSSLVEPIVLELRESKWETNAFVRVQHISAIVERMQKDPPRIDPTAADKSPCRWGIKSNVEYSTGIPEPFFMTVPETTMHFGLKRSITWQPREIGKNRLFYTCGELWSVDCSMVSRLSPGWFDRSNYTITWGKILNCNSKENETENPRDKPKLSGTESHKSHEERGF